MPRQRPARWAPRRLLRELEGAPGEAVVGSPVLEVLLEPLAHDELRVLVHGDVPLVEEPVDVGAEGQAVGHVVLPALGVGLDVRCLRGRGLTSEDAAGYRFVMEIFRFKADQLSSELAAKGGGDAFQQLVHELLLPSHPGLHLFRTGGKDGGIDLIHDAPAGKTVFECKYLGENGIAPAEARWKEVAKHLKDHVVDPVGPTRGQSQYRPWYETEPGIVRYVFCISSLLDNQSQRASLRKTIADFLRELAKRPHLSHLAAVDVVVLDASDFATHINAAPHTLFAWFPTAVPRGFEPLEYELPSTVFRAYLFGNKLPYYSLEQHLAAHPPPLSADILNEDRILDRFDRVHTGLVISGGGGYGKTRLLLELGRRAHTRGWVVLRLNQHATGTAIEALARRLTPSTPALLLIDYIEAHRSYDVVVDTVNHLADNLGLELRYAACCRTSFYGTLKSSGRHFHVDLAPLEHAASAPFLDEYRRRTVRHILECSGIAATEPVLAMCGATPVLAVFAAWLKARGRDADLRALLEHDEFGAWMVNWVERSFPQSGTVSEDLATVVALLPFDERAVPRLDKNHAALVEVLAQDGWIARVKGEGEVRWEAAHDVLADRVLLGYLESRRATQVSFIGGLFEKAIRAGSLRSALIALQRLAGKLPHLDWRATAEITVGQDAEAWRAVNDLVSRSSMFDPEARIALLARRPQLFAKLEETCRSIAGATFIGFAFVPNNSVTEYVPGINPGPPGLEEWTNRFTVAVHLRPDVSVDAVLIRRLEEALRTQAPAWMSFVVGTFEGGFMAGVGVVGRTLL